MVKALLPIAARPLLELQLTSELEVHWFADRSGAETGIGDAGIAWVDFLPRSDMAKVVALGSQLRWLFTSYAGVDTFDLASLAANGTLLTNGAGINAAAVADYAAMAVLVAAKRFDQVVRLADRHQWTSTSPGTRELEGSRALVIGYGAIGRHIGARLKAFGIDVTGVTRNGGHGTLSSDQWRDRLDQYDWVILAAPATPKTFHTIGAAELSAMNRQAWLINMARGHLVDHDALMMSLQEHRIAGAFLDAVTPEPLPFDHPLWSAPNLIHSLHLSGRSQQSMLAKAASLFLDNLTAFRDGLPLRNQVDLARGY